MQQAMERMSDDWFIRKVQAQKEEFYRLSPEPRLFLGKELVREFEDILGQIRSLNDEFVGFRVSQVKFMLNGDPRVEQIRDQLRRWGEGYVQARLDRRNPKDQGQHYQQFFRIFYELPEELNRISWLEGSVHLTCLGELSLFLPWCLFQHVMERAQAAGLSPESPRNNDDWFLPPIQESLGGRLNWNREGDIGRTLEPIAAHFQEEFLDRKTILQRLADMAADIVEMRPLLFRNFRPEKVRIPLAPGVAISWEWSQGEGIGQVPVGESPEDLLESLRTGKHQAALYLRSDGRLGNRFLPWLHVRYDADLEVHQANLKVVEAIHQRLLEFWTPIDRNAVIEAWRNRSSELTEVENEELEDAALAAMTYQLAEEEEPECSPGEKPKQKRIPKMKALKLFSVLERHFGCEISSAKGSEKKVFRPGGRIYKLGWHEKNRVISSHQTRDILGRLGILVPEFLTVLTR
jgi:hypothetical protein